MAKESLNSILAKKKEKSIAPRPDRLLGLPGPSSPSTKLMGSAPCRDSETGAFSVLTGPHRRFSEGPESCDQFVDRWRVRPSGRSSGGSQGWRGWQEYAP